jgi:hypothetical protein
VAAAPSQAALFGDDEARRAILELRQKVDANAQRQTDETARASETWPSCAAACSTCKTRSRPARRTGQAARPE